MAKKEATTENKEATFHCKFCGQSKPLSEMTFMTRYYPILVACRSCDGELQSLKSEEPVDELMDEEIDEEEEAEETAE